MPAVLNGQNVCDEVAFRIANRLPANGTGAGSIINFTNDILGLIGASSSWVWDEINQFSATVSSISNTVNLGTNVIDLGKKISAFDSTSKQPIVRVTQDDQAASSAGYVGTDGKLNAFSTFVDSGTLLANLIFFPLSLGGTVDLSYHLIPPVLVYNTTPTVRWVGIYGMDALFKDWATANTMKYLGMSGWDASWADCMGRLGEFRKMYSTERINTGPEDEAPAALQEKQTIGRV